MSRSVYEPRHVIAFLAVLFATLAVMSLSDVGFAQHERNPGASFPGWSQDFGGDADEWFGFDDGWCGSFELVPGEAGDLTPTVGSGYARVTGGACVEQFADAFQPSGPYSGGVALSEAWPEGGFVEQLDVHLDPDRDTGFDYFVPLSLLDVREADGLPASVRYTRVRVADRGDALSVGGHAVDEAGWYTFRHRFTADDQGMLTIEFELLDADGEQVGSHAIEEHLGATSLEDPQPIDVPVDNVGSAYVWFHLPDDATVAIDRYSVRKLD